MVDKAKQKTRMPLPTYISGEHNLNELQRKVIYNYHLTGIDHADILDLIRETKNLRIIIDRFIPKHMISGG